MVANFGGHGVLIPESSNYSGETNLSSLYCRLQGREIGQLGGCVSAGWVNQAALSYMRVYPLVHQRGVPPQCQTSVHNQIGQTRMVKLTFAGYIYGCYCLFTETSTAL